MCVKHIHFAVKTQSNTASQTKYTLIKNNLKKKENFHCRLRVHTMWFNVSNNALRNKHFNVRKSKRSFLFFHRQSRSAWKVYLNLYSTSEKKEA